MSDIKRCLYVQVTTNNDAILYIMLLFTVFQLTGISEA